MLGFLFTAALAIVSVKIDGTTLVIEGEDRVTSDEFVTALSNVNIDSNLDGLKVSEGIYSIAGDAFQPNPTIDDKLAKFYGITTVDLGNIETLEDNLFHASFTQINQVTFGNKIRYIGENFEGCENLDIDIPATVERVNPKLLHWIKSFKLAQGNKRYAVCDETETQYLLYANQSSIFGIANTKNPLDIKFPDCITEIDTLSQYGINIQISSIDFNKVTSIRRNTFVNCQFTESELTLPATIEKIEGGAFPNNMKIVLGEGVTNFEIVELGGFEFIKGANDGTLIHINPESITEEERELELTNEYILYPKMFSVETTITFKSLKIDCAEIPAFAFEKAVIKYLDLGTSVLKVGEGAFKEASISNATTIPRNIVEIGKEAFSKAITAPPQVGHELPNWCILEIGTTFVQERAFNDCHGLKAVIICAKNVTIGRYAFNNCDYLEYVNNSDGGYISHILAAGFAASNSMFNLDLTEDIESVALGSMPMSTHIFDEYGMIIAGSKLVACNVDYKDFNEKVLTLDQVKYILDNALRVYVKPQVSLVFPNVVEIGENVFYSAKLDSVTFGPNLVKMGHVEKFDVNSVYFQSETVTFPGKQTRFNFEVKDKIQLPKNIIHYNSHFNSPFSVFINSNIEQAVTINGATYEIKTDKSIILSSPNYTSPAIYFSGDDYKLVIKSTVRTIKYSVFMDTFDSVTIEEGIENLEIGFKSNSKIVIPASVKTMSYQGTLEDELDLTNSQLEWKDGFLITKDQKRLCGYVEGADINKVPAVEVIGAYALYKFTTGTEDNPGSFTLPKGVKIIEENSLPHFTKIITNGNEIEVIESMLLCPEAELDILPSSLTKIATFPLLYYKGKIDKSVKAFELSDNVIYFKDQMYLSQGNEKTYKLALALDDKTVDTLHIDCEVTYQNYVDDVKELKNTLKEVSLSERAAQSSDVELYFQGYEKLEKFPSTNSRNFNISGTAVKNSLNFSAFYETDIYTGERVYKSINVNANTIPAGVLDIYINGPVEKFGAQKHSPWIHIPSNLGLTSADFNGMPVIYDMEDFVQPEDPGEPEPEPEETEAVPSDPEPDASENDQKPGDAGNQGNGLNGGQIAGIVIGVLVAVALIGFAVYWFVFRKKSDGIDKSASASSSENEV